MADNQSARLPQYTTERGVFIYPHLVVADTKFDAKGAFRTGFRPVSREYGEKLKALIEEAQEAEFQRAVAEAKPNKKSKIKKESLPFEEVLNDQEQPTGDYQFRFKIVAGGVAKKTGKEYSNKPAMFDGTGKPCSLDVYSGAEGKLTFIISTFTNEMGSVFVSLKPRAVQILQLAGGGGSQKGASQFGFGADENGFDASDFDGASTTDAVDEGDDADKDALL